ncbi:MAG TPA: hypothetical protein VMF58_13935 [Rhizomicrobium sp.]|nr:hypothetical protein [Rhizomicrobium sp.]
MRLVCLVLGTSLLASPAFAQMGNMPGMDMPQAATPSAPAKPMDDMAAMKMDMPMAMSSNGILGTYPMTRDASGTSWQPDAADHAMLETMAGEWMLMGHVMLTGIYDSQSGPRGGDKTFLAGMAMGAARRDFGDGDTLNFRAMLSPDPFMGKSGYPLLLATGETANGTTPLIDRQHPHDLFMELSGTFSHRFTSDDSGFLYLGYPGEPALGPTAFMHRASSMDIPEAPITHHWLDSTHITFGVVTAGFVHDDVKFEVSQFTGREPDQDRFDFDPIRLDSTAVRVSWNPDANWSLQTSWGYLKSPEQLEPLIDENRLTASATYVTPLGEGSSLAATLAWGEKMLSDGTNLNGVMLETEYKPADLWTVFARAEWEENNELIASGTKESVGKLSLGVIKDWRVAEHWKVGLGGSYDFVFVPGALKAAYGSDPHGTTIFTRIAVD